MSKEYFPIKLEIDLPSSEIKVGDKLTLRGFAPEGKFRVTEVKPAKGLQGWVTLTLVGFDEIESMPTN